MSIDYSIAGPWALHVHALALNESSGNPDVPKSDGGRARGLLGFHPCTFQEYYGRSPNFPRDVGHTWDESDISAAASFLDIEVPRFAALFPAGVALDLAIQAHQAGVSAVMMGGRNPKYLADWTTSFQKLRGTNDMGG